jgi:hypothetical protein
MTNRVLASTGKIIDLIPLDANYRHRVNKGRLRGSKPR